MSRVIAAALNDEAAILEKKQKLEKGMFVETSTMTSTPPLSVQREQPMLAQLFMSKYGIEVDPKHMNNSHFTCEKIG